MRETVGQRMCFCLVRFSLPLPLSRPTPDPSPEGSKHLSASRLFASWEGLGVGSWSQCKATRSLGFSMNLPPTHPPLTPPKRGTGELVLTQMTSRSSGSAFHLSLTPSLHRHLLYFFSARLFYC